MMSRGLRGASLLVVALVLAIAEGDPRPFALGTSAVALALGLSSRLRLDPLATRIAVVLAAGAGGGVGWALPSAALRAPWPSLALAGIFAGAALLAARTRGRASPIGLLPGIVALAAAGEGHVGVAYPIGVAAHLILAFAAARAASHETWPPTRHGGALVLGLVVAGAAGMSVALALAVPPLASYGQARILRALGAAEIGFSDRMALGSLEGLFASDEVVLRVSGAKVDYLRGAVFDRYEKGRWSRSKRPVFAPLPAPPVEDGAPRTSIVVEGDPYDRFFTPLGARGIRTDPVAEADDFGVLRSVGSAREVSFDALDAVEVARPADFPPAPPNERDLEIALGLRPLLERIAMDWTRGATGDGEKIAAIRDHLRAEYHYALEFDHHRRRDPLFDFLLDDHAGHCEYFATALTLLARAANIPARVAVGYRVAEEDPLGAGFVVRSRNAHAWSEVYLAGRGFVTVDATPEGAVPANSPHRGHLLQAAWELVSERASRAVAALRPSHAVGIAAVGGLLAVARQLRRRGGRGQVEGAEAGALEPAPRELEILFEACAARGFARAAWEPLESFAARLEREAATRALGGVVRAWAAHRYGGVGPQAPLLASMEAAARELRRRPPDT